MIERHPQTILLCCAPSANNIVVRHPQTTFLMRQRQCEVVSVLVQTLKFAVECLLHDLIALKSSWLGLEPSEAVERIADCEVRTDDRTVDHSPRVEVPKALLWVADCKVRTGGPEVGGRP